MEKIHNPGNTTAEVTGFNSVLMKDYRPGLFKPVRRIIEYPGITKTDREAIVKFYENLVPQNKNLTIDLRMIVEEAFPKFEETIGVENFAKLKRYFGIGVKRPSKNALRESDYNVLIGRLRTIENAQYYIAGYKTLIEKVARKLGNAPEGMTTLEKAKLVRMFMVIFAGYNYFLEDCIYWMDGEHVSTVVNFNKVPDNNKAPFRPEELFVLFDYKLNTFSDEGLIYDLLLMEVQDLDKKTRNEVLAFAELKLDPEKGFCSVNDTVPYQTFGTIRATKRKVHQEPGVFPLESFCCMDMFFRFDFDVLYAVYKALRSFTLEEFTTVERDITCFEGSRRIDKKHPCYEIIKGVEVGGSVEASRFVRLMEFAMTTGYNIPIRKDEEGNDIPVEDVKFYDVRSYMAAIKFANQMGYLNAFTEIKRDFEVAELFIERDVDDALKRYIFGEIDVSQLKAILEIDDEFEEEFLEISHGTPAEKAALAFAVENGYVKEADEETMELISKVVVPGNESIWEKYRNGEIEDSVLKGEIGFEEEFGEMYFDFKKIDITIIENKLMDLKRARTDKKKMRKSGLAIALYCYVVKEQIPCGPKMKIPKGNKSLKPSNLMAIIDQSE